jgi:D-glycero-alpha-D-manno-heptose 1-phosphate guanylyltransferase
MTGAVRQAVFLVGGLGTRLGELTKATPKPLLPVAGRPFLDHLLEKAANSGLTDMVLLAGHASDAIDAYLAAHAPAERFGLTIAVSTEPDPLGTAGAVINALPLLAEAFLLINGDTWFDFDWRTLADADPYPAMLALRVVEHPDRYETVALEGRLVTGFFDRNTATPSRLINGGVYQLKKTVLANLPSGPMSFEKDLAPILCAKGQLGGQVFGGLFIDIGVPESYAAAQALLGNNRGSTF